MGAFQIANEAKNLTKQRLYIHIVTKPCLSAAQVNGDLMGTHPGHDRCSVQHVLKLINTYQASQIFN